MFQRDLYSILFLFVLLLSVPKGLFSSVAIGDLFLIPQRTSSQLTVWHVRIQHIVYYKEHCVQWTWPMEVKGASFNYRLMERKER